MSPLIIRLPFATEMDLWANYSARNLWPFLEQVCALVLCESCSSRVILGGKWIGPKAAKIKGPVVESGTRSW
jgi:hypothetical protein